MGFPLIWEMSAAFPWNSSTLFIDWSSFVGPFHCSLIRALGCEADCGLRRCRIEEEEEGRHPHFLPLPAIVLPIVNCVVFPIFPVNFAFVMPEKRIYHRPSEKNSGNRWIASKICHLLRIHSFISHFLGWWRNEGVEVCGGATPNVMLPLCVNNFPQRERERERKIEESNCDFMPNVAATAQIDGKLLLDETCESFHTFIHPSIYQ